MKQKDMGTEKYKNLLSPIRVGNRVYKHRMAASPIYCGTFAMDPVLSMMLENGILTRAYGGCAQVTFGETPVDFVHANREPFPEVDYRIHGGDFFEKISALAEECKRAGAVTFIELSHCGNSKQAIPGMEEAYGPVDGVTQAGVKVIGMDKEKMDETVNNFVECALFMKAAGFDGVLLHAGHGWLIHQFLSPRTNTRDDAYGGTLEGRARFPLEIFREVRRAVGEDFLIEVRVSGEECAPGGMGIDEVADFCRMAEPYVDLFHMSVGTYRDPVLSGEFSSMYQPHGLNAGMAKRVKEAVNKPVAVVGGINDPEQAERLITEGYCDIVAFGRQLTADPDFPNKVLAGCEDDITKCIRCFKCFPGPLEDQLDDGEMTPDKLPGCTVNPRAFLFDKSIGQNRPEHSEKVLVIGGGIAGMEAAITACDRGHQVILAEKSGRLGGLLHFTDTDAYKSDLHQFMELMIRRVAERPIEVRLNCEIRPQDLDEISADVVLVAVGSEPLVLPIPGIENAIPALEVYQRMDEADGRVIIAGGGLVGCEVGLHLAKNGRTVTIIEMRSEIAPDAYPMHRVGMLQEMQGKIEIYTDMKCIEINRESLIAENKDGDRVTFYGDCIVTALGMKEKSAVRDAFLEKGDGGKVVAVGDCVKASKVYDCMMQGYLAAMKIL